MTEEAASLGGADAFADLPLRAARTVGAAVAAAAARLQAKGFTAADAKREAAEIYGGLLCAATSKAWVDRALPIAEGIETRFNHAVAKRIGGMPQAYAVGRANFRGLWLAVDGRVLIP